jgi:hypothetical protein
MANKKNARMSQVERTQAAITQRAPKINQIIVITVQ